MRIGALPTARDRRPLYLIAPDRLEHSIQRCLRRRDRVRTSRVVPKQELHTDRFGFRDQVLNLLLGVLPLVPLGIDEDVVPTLFAGEVDVLRLELRGPGLLAEPRPGRASRRNPAGIVKPRWYGYARGEANYSGAIPLGIPLKAARAFST